MAKLADSCAEIMVEGSRLEFLSIPVRGNVSGNVIGGSLDGASIPDGTRDGQVLVWDIRKRRWVDQHARRV